MTDRSAFELFVMDLKRGATKAAKTGAVLGVATAGAVQGMAGCLNADQAQEAGRGEIIGNWGHDWAQQQGVRDTRAVRFDKNRPGAIQGQYTDCYGRGCSGAEISVQLLVDNSYSHSGIDNKRVGIVYRGTSTEGTAMARYTGTDGDKEVWTATVKLRGYEQHLFAFTAFYQTEGYGSRPYYDDNEGQLHVADWSAGYTNAASYWGSSLKAVKVGERYHIQGHVEIRVADIAESKRLGFVYTTQYQMNNYGYPDGIWPEAGQNAPAFFGDGHGAGMPNTWYWVRDEGGGSFEVWAIDIDIPAAEGQAPFLEYAMVYEHGNTNGATKYRFWLNGGGYGYNYTFYSPLPAEPPPPAEVEPVEGDPVAPAEDGQPNPPAPEPAGPTG